MVFVAALPDSFSDAVTIVSGCSLGFGALTWAVIRIWMISHAGIDLERWVLDGVGAGAVIGIALAVVYLAL